MFKISVIVPCYNVEDKINRCVQSLINQTIGLKHLEIILVNDASQDHTYRKLCEWESKYPENILVVNSAENMKQGGARNIGLTYATGSYIGFVDSDDWIELDMYRILYENIEKYQVDISAVFFQRETEDGQIIPDDGEHRPILGKKVEICSEEDRKWFLRTGLPGGVYTKLYRRELIFDHQIFFPEHLYYEDNFFSSVLQFYIGSYFVFNKALYHYMFNPASTIASKGAHHLDRLVIEEMKIKEYKKRGFYEIYYAEIEAEFLRLYWCNTLHNFFVKFDTVPFKIIDQMREKVLEMFPRYKKNPYYSEFNGVEKLLLQLIEKNLSPAALEEVAKVYRSE